jgi:hypothetical protein
MLATSAVMSTAGGALGNLRAASFRRSALLPPALNGGEEHQPVEHSDPERGDKPDRGARAPGRPATMI